MVQSFLKRAGLSVGALFIVAMCTPDTLNAQQVEDEAKLELEFIYLERLEAAGFANIAELVLKDIEVKFPGAKVQIKVKKLAQLLSRGKFDEAKAEIKKEPDQNSAEVWGMKCSMADYYFAFGKYEDAFEEYKKFFDKFKGNPPEELRKIYNDSYYKYAQMLLMLNRDEEALEAYEAMRTSKSGMPSNMQRQIAFENAELLVRLAEENAAKKDAYIKRATPIVENILWTQDLWFARSVALLAHIKVLQNDLKGAEDVISDNMPMIKQMDKQLMEIGKAEGQDYSRLSPLAESRYLVGQMLHNEALRMVAEGKTSGEDGEKIKKLLITGNPNAMTEFANVYIRYPASSWAPDAGARIDAIKDLATQLWNRTPELKITNEQREAVANKQFENAKLQYNQNQFQAAIDSYLDVINRYPHGERAIVGVGDMIRSANKLSLTLETETEREYYKILEDTFIGHLAEFFGGESKDITVIEAAGNEMLVLVQFYQNAKMDSKAKYVQEKYYNYYPEHSMAADLLFSDAKKLFAEEKYEEAKRKFEILAEKYTKSYRSVDALRSIGDCYNKLGDYKQETLARRNWLKRVQKEKSHNLILAKYYYARTLKTYGVAELRAAKLAQNEKMKASAVTSTSDVAEEVAPTAVENATAEQTEEIKDKKERTPEERIKIAMGYLGIAQKQLDEIEKLLSPETVASYQSSTKEIEVNQTILESVYLDRAYLYSIESNFENDKAEAKSKKLSSIEQYRKLREKFPKSKNMPMILMQLGTLLSSVERNDAEPTEESNSMMEEAQAIFAELAEKYPESNEAKNVHYIQGKTLIDLGYESQGVAVLKKMFENEQKYSAIQLQDSADLLFKYKIYGTALDGYNLALKKAEGDERIIARCIYGKATVLHAQKNYEEAVKLLDEFQTNYPRSYLLINVLNLMSECGVEAARNEKDEKKRIELFNSSMKAVKLVRQYSEPTAENLINADIRMGIILQTYAEIAKKWKDEKRADEYIRRAAGQYQKILMSADYQNDDILPSIEEVYLRSIEISLELGLYDYAKDDCEKYMKYFDQGKFLGKINTYKIQAEQGLLQSKSK